MGDKVIAASPGLFNPFMDASEVALTGRDTGRIALANGYASHGELVRRVRSGSGRVTEFWVGGSKLLPEARIMAEMEKRYGEQKRRRNRR
jgi:hypothetical protein